MRALHGGRRGQRRRDAISGSHRIANELEGQERRAPVLGDLPRVGRGQGRLDPRH